MVEAIREFVAETERGEKNSRVVVTAVMCDSSVSVSLGKLTIHIPWTEVAAWVTVLAEQTQTAIWRMRADP